MMSIEQLTEDFRRYNLKILSIEAGLYFTIADLPSSSTQLDGYSFSIVDDKIIVSKFNSEYKECVLLSIDRISELSVADQVVNEIQNFHQYEESNKETLDLVRKLFMKLQNGSGIANRICSHCLFHTVYKIDDVYQYRLQIVISSREKSYSPTIYITIDVNNKVLQVCLNNVLYLSYISWRRSLVEPQPSEILYKIDIFSLKNIVLGELCNSLVSLIANHYDYILQKGNILSIMEGREFESLKVDIGQKCTDAIIINNVSPAIKQSIGIYRGGSPILNVLLRQEEYPSIINIVEATTEIAVGQYKIYGLNSMEGAIEFINDLLESDKLNPYIAILKELTINKDYLLLNKSAPNITVEIDYSAGQIEVVSVRSSHYVFLSNKINFIMELVFEEDRKYYSFLNSAKGDVIKIPFTDILGLVEACKGYILGSYKSLPDKVVTELWGEEV